MNLFSTYTNELGRYTVEVLSAPVGSFKKKDIRDSLFSTEQVEQNLRSLIPIDELRDAGSFFTGDSMADNAVKPFGDSMSRQSLIIDPACGAGNLLIACSKKLPVTKSSLRKTLENWGKCLVGFDLFDEFVEATKLRLILEGVSRGARSDISDVDEAKALLPYIQEGDAFDYGTTLSKATHIIVNPPYYKMATLESCGWADGQINAAAKFMDHIVENVTHGAYVSAILPDVLRSGSRYAKWRSLMSSKLRCSVISAGRFNSKTDVDVFLFSGRSVAAGEEPDWLGVECCSGNTVGDFFDISIGPVVPYRDKQDSEKAAPYIYPKQLPLWEEIRDQDIEETWNYAGTLKKPPFVAIRRTSSPTDTYRAAGTLIKGSIGIAVENHLIVARPKSNRVGDCKRLLEVLKNKKTNDFLNQRIRCRHLTASAIKETPWIGDPVE